MSREYPCVHWNDGKCQKYSDGVFTSYCVEGPCGQQQMSNADRIRAMSDEELAAFLESWGCCHHCIEHERLSDNRWFSDERCDEKCVEHCLEWLKQPAEQPKEG